MHTNQMEHTMTEQFERFVKPTTPAFTLFEPERFHMVPRSKSTIHEFAEVGFIVKGNSRVGAALDTDPEELVQMASDALLLAEHLRERQAAVQAEKEAEKDAHHKELYRAMARKAREIHGVSK